LLDPEAAAIGVATSGTRATSAGGSGAADVRLGRGQQCTGATAGEGDRGVTRVDGGARRKSTDKEAVPPKFGRDRNCWWKKQACLADLPEERFFLTSGFALPKHFAIVRRLKRVSLWRGWTAKEAER